MEGLDSKTLLAGMKFWEKVLGMAIGSLASLAPIFNSQMMMMQIQTATQLMQRLEEMKGESEQQQDQKAAIPDEMTNQLRMMMMNLVMNMLSNSMGAKLPIQLPQNTLASGQTPTIKIEK